MRSHRHRDFLTLPEHFSMSEFFRFAKILWLPLLQLLIVRNFSLWLSFNSTTNVDTVSSMKSFDSGIRKHITVGKFFKQVHKVCVPRNLAHYINACHARWPRLVQLFIIFATSSSQLRHAGRFLQQRFCVYFCFYCTFWIC